MITIAGPSSDWDQLADFLGDESWRGSRMRAYFQKLEHNDYSPPATPVPTSWWRRAWDNVRWLFGSDPDHTSGRHGFKGWLHTSVVDLELGLHDKQLVKMLKAALWQAKKSGLEGAWSLVSTFLNGRIKQWLDPNHVRTQMESPEGLALVPLAVCGQGTTIHQNAAEPFVMRGHRSSPRELLLKVKASHPDNLEIWTECFVTKLLFDKNEPTRVIGVEYKKGARLYKAHVNPVAAPAESKTVCVRPGGEVILCGGTFNTPQLLMLSGIGDEKHLKDKKIACRVHSPGVGKNLQDRYEVTVISEMEKEFSVLNKATFSLPSDPANPTDPHLVEWRSSGTGLYSSNGAVLSIFKRSRPELAQPDLFMFGTPLPFEGYKVGWSKVGDQHNFFTWVILKSHTNNHDGTVELRTKDPLDTPVINFHYFNEMSRPNQTADDPDLAAIVEGVKFVRSIATSARVVVRGEQFPGQTEVSETNDARMKDWIRRVTWGHHACGTCRMGPDGDSLAVLDSRFKVRGVSGLRVVDASVFPKIPGYFIVANIYMVSEKAADVILQDAVSAHADSPAYPRELRRREEVVIVNRRERLLPPLPGRVPVPAADDDNWNPDVAGLGLSGGGVRSAPRRGYVAESLRDSGDETPF